MSRKYKPQLNLKQVKSFTLTTRHDFPKNTNFIVFVENDGYFAIPDGRTKQVNARWIDTAFRHKKIGKVQIYAQT